jgi:hypothetical protein
VRRALIFASLLSASLASAEPNLKLERSPAPRTLRMRRPVAQVPSATRPRSTIPMPAAPVATTTAILPSDPIEEIDGVRDVRRPVSFSLTMGYQVDGARPSEKPALSGLPVRPGIDYATLRSYGFGEGFLSTRGVGMGSLETYFALRFQAARTITTDAIAPTAEPVDVTSPIATWFSRSGTEIRQGWAEVRDFLPKRFGLSKLRVRAGSQFVYGPWILHLDGGHIAYEGPTLTAALYGGYRHSDYTRDQSQARPRASGGSLRIDLRGLTNAVPIAVAGEYLALSASDETGQDAVDTALGQIDWRPRRDIVVIAQMRGVNGEMANQRLELRTRYKQVTNFVFDVMRRFEADWRWDPALARPSSITIGEVTGALAQSLDARRYLDLGPVLPQLIFSARAGTLIRENIDLLARVALARDLLDEESGELPNTYTAPYVEIGGAVEIRLRRQIALALSVLSRQTQREVVDPADRIVDNPLSPLDPDPLPDRGVPDPALNTLGEQGFTELGATLKMTLGARRFSALVEVYGRNTRYSVLYTDPMTAIPEDDVRGGGRFTLDAWVGRRVRLFASYDVSSQLDNAPEISGYKSLRLTLTGIY